MPVSKFLMSVGQFVLLGNWIIEGDFKRKRQIIKTSKLLWVLCSFYALHLIGLFYTSDFNYALNDLRIKLPLLWFPLLFATSKPLEKKEIDTLLNVFIASVFTASIVSMFVLLGYTKRKVSDIRDISIFNSHIRFALMIVLSICALLYNYFKTEKALHYILKAVLALWFIVFLCIMESLTGLIILVVVLYYLLIQFFRNQKKPLLKLFPFLLLSLGGFMLFYIIHAEWRKYYTVQKIDFKTAYAKKTPNGNIYENDSTKKVTENGHYLWMNNSFGEMREAWQKRSQLGFDSLDQKGNTLAFTLARYLTSKGLTKDSLAVSSLGNEEIKLVEKGVSNYLYPNTGSIRSRIHEVIWEYDSYINGVGASGHSLLMRLEFWKTGLNIIRKQPVLGVGTGDVQVAYNRQYKADNSKLTERWHLRSHNQFIAIGVAFGLIGILLFFIWLFAPLFMVKQKNPLFPLFFIIGFLSMLNEDTLETQAGVTFFGFFYCFFLLNEGIKSREPGEIKPGIE